jgi:quercetin dioxygenase-like cupin family protein
MKHIIASDLTFETQEGSGRVLVLDEKDFGLNAKMQIIQVNPGVQPRAHYHKVRTELAYIISGEGDIVVDGNIVVSKPGEFVLVEPGEVHTVVNRGSDALVTMLLIANDPGPEDMIYVEKEEKNE